MIRIKHFISAFIFFIVILVCADRLLGFILDKLFFSEQGKLSYALNECIDDIIILGASNAEAHYDANIISDSTTLSVFNFGSGGQNIYYHYAILNTILKHHTPKVVILELGGIDYLVTPPRWDKEQLPSSLGPLYFHCDTVSNIIDAISPSEKCKYLSRIYPFNSTVDDIIYSFLKGNNNAQIKNKGYVPIKESFHLLTLTEEDLQGKEFDTAKIEYIERFIELCKSQNIKIIIVRSPAYYIKTTNYSNLVYERLNKRIGIEIWDYEQDSSFLSHREYFKDALHMNQRGATIYSQIIAKRLKKELNQY
jgi:lysophospholipase L1-like esterase